MEGLVHLHFGGDKMIAPLLQGGGGKGSQKCDSGGGFGTPPPFLKIACVLDTLTPFLRTFFGGILLDGTCKVLSLPPIQPLLILSP